MGLARASSSTIVARARSLYAETDRRLAGSCQLAGRAEPGEPLRLEMAAAGVPLAANNFELAWWRNSKINLHDDDYNKRSKIQADMARSQWDRFSAVASAILRVVWRATKVGEAARERERELASGGETK